MDMSKEHFVRFVREACANHESMAFKELYIFLLHCFTRADTNRDGQVDASEFDTMCEEAAAAPRKLGLAPQSSQLYPNAEARIKARTELFKKMDTNNDGGISFDEWLAYAVTHIMGKVAGLKRDPLHDGTKEEFVAFIKKAVVSGSTESVDLYYFLIKCFVEADQDRNGTIDLAEFDCMVDVAAAAARRHGLAPMPSTLYKDDAARLAARKVEYHKMDLNHDNTISFDEWLSYAKKHIIEKIATL